MSQENNSGNHIEGGPNSNGIPVARPDAATAPLDSHYEVVIIGAGLAGLSLAAQLLKYSQGKTILLLDKWDDPPRPTQKTNSASSMRN